MAIRGTSFASTGRTSALVTRLRLLELDLRKKASFVFTGMYPRPWAIWCAHRCAIDWLSDAHPHQVIMIIIMMMMIMTQDNPGQTQPLDLVWRNWVSTSHRRFFLNSYHFFQLLAFTSEDTICMNNCHLGDHGLCCWRSGAFIFVLKILFYLIYEKNIGFQSQFYSELLDL